MLQYEPNMSGPEPGTTKGVLKALQFHQKYLSASCENVSNDSKPEDSTAQNPSESEPDKASIIGKLDSFLLNALNSPKDRLMLLKLDDDYVRFISDPSISKLEFPPMTSYHRLIVHRAAQYFGLDHVVDSSGRCVHVYKNDICCIPTLRFLDYVETEEEAAPKVKIMRRRDKADKNQNSETRDGGKSFLPGEAESRKNMSIEQRERAYMEARARIFQDSVQNFGEPVPSEDILNSQNADLQKKTGLDSSLKKEDDGEYRRPQNYYTEESFDESVHDFNSFYRFPNYGLGPPLHSPLNFNHQFSRQSGFVFPPQLDLFPSQNCQMPYHSSTSPTPLNLPQHHLHPQHPHQHHPHHQEWQPSNMVTSNYPFPVHLPGYDSRHHSLPMHPNFSPMIPVLPFPHQNPSSQGFSHQQQPQQHHHHHQQHQHHQQQHHHHQQ
eukprot:Sdes_comp9728_c0_seq1m1230